MNKKKILTWILFFLIFFSIAQLFSKKSGNDDSVLKQGKLGIATTNSEYVTEQEVILKIRNNTAEAVTLGSSCPHNPFTVLAFTGEKFEERKQEAKIDCTAAPDITIAPDAEKTVTYNYWNHALFGLPGRYKIEVPYKGETFSSPEFTVAEAGFLRKAFRTGFYQPLYNVLIFFLSIAPARDLGFAIILLTLVIRLILLIPSQRAIVSQRRMQELQPKLEHIKKEYAGNQERIASETMQLWKQHKVNPFGSCLPLLIQFPVLIALFYVIQNGLNPNNTYMLYGGLKDFDLAAIHTNFLGILDLTKVNIFVLPLLVGALQFIQMQLTFSKKKIKPKRRNPRWRWQIKPWDM